jgi:hypothetical protein
MRNPVVDVVVIGAMKCGSTAIYHLFKKNEAFAVNKGKEVNFFLKEFDETSLAAYDRTFLPGQIRVDVSPSYSKYHVYKTNIAKEIHRANPDARIIYLVRDPLKRIESHLYHNLLRDRIDRRKLTDLNYLHSYILTSSYFAQIGRFLEYFKKSNILVLQQEQMRNEPSKIIEALSNFLAIPWAPTETIKEYHASDQKYFIPKYDRVIKTMGVRFTTKIYNPFWSLLGVRSKPITLDDRIKDTIRNKLRDDIHSFCTLFSLDKSLWNYFFNNESDR